MYAYCITFEPVDEGQQPYVYHMKAYDTLNSMQYAGVKMGYCQHFEYNCAVVTTHGKINAFKMQTNKYGALSFSIFNFAADKVERSIAGLDTVANQVERV